MDKSNNRITRNKEKFCIKKDDKTGLGLLVFPKGNIVELSDGLFLSTTRIGEELLQEVYIPDKVEIVGNKCFKNCTNLEKVTFPDSVTSIGNACFRGCKKLKSVRLPNNIKILPEYLFSWCSNLVNIHIPDGVTTILDSCFFNCTNLKSIDLPETVSKIGESAFSNCTSLKTFSFNDNIEYISDEMFLGCENLEEITLPIGLEGIGNKAFSECYNLKKVKLPNFLTSIGENAFEECSSLKEITIPPYVKRIDFGAFSNCVNLETVNILPDMPHSKSSLIIQDGAFSECTNLKSLYLPSGVLKNNQAFDFSNMPNLKQFNYAGRNILNLSEGEVFTNLLYNGKLFYIEYINQSNETISKVLEDTTSKKRDIRSVELAKHFNDLRMHSVFQDNFKFDDEKNKLCLNMLSILDYNTCVKFLDMLQQRNNDNNLNDDAQKDNEKGKIRRKNSNSKNKHSKSISGDTSGDIIADIIAEAETNGKKSLFTKIKEKILKLLNKEPKSNNVQKIKEISDNEFVKTLFDSPKILSNEYINEFNTFFSNNIKDIINTTSTDELENLARIQRNFKEFIRNPIIRRKIQSGKLKLSEALQNKSLYITAGHEEEFAQVDTESKKSEKYHQSSYKSHDLEL